MTVQAEAYAEYYFVHFSKRSSAVRMDSRHRVSVNPGTDRVLRQPQVQRRCSSCSGVLSLTSCDGQDKFWSRSKCALHLHIWRAQRSDHRPKRTCKSPAIFLRLCQNEAGSSPGSDFNWMHTANICRCIRSNFLLRSKVNGHRTMC